MPGPHLFPQLDTSRRPNLAASSGPRTADAFRAPPRAGHNPPTTLPSTSINDANGSRSPSYLPHFSAEKNGRTGLAVAVSFFLAELGVGVGWLWGTRCLGFCHKRRLERRRFRHVARADYAKSDRTSTRIRLDRPGCLGSTSSGPAKCTAQSRPPQMSPLK